MQTSLLAIANKAKDRKHYRFLNLYRLIGDENFLLECWRDIRKDAAFGVDRISAEKYGENLINNIRDLIERIKRKSYRARLVRRHYIPKPDGRMRPLGIPVVEDKLLQLAVTRILEAIYEQDFLRCSYGYRPNKGALDAVDKLTVKLQFGRYNFVVEADIKGFFDNINHDRLIELLSLRIADQSLLRLIKKWLKAGVLNTDGKVIHPTSGTPQGGIISPLLANVYLHYALDLWFQEVEKTHAKGEACLIRYADDFVCAFQNEHNAEAPDLMEWYQEPCTTGLYSHCIFCRQPETPDEVQQAIRAMNVSCVENLRYRGTNPAIVKQLHDMGKGHLCDALETE
jgi:RNA-directed DNA polymerase